MKKTLKYEIVIAQAITNTAKVLFTYCKSVTIYSDHNGTLETCSKVRTEKQPTEYICPVTISGRVEVDEIAIDSLGSLVNVLYDNIARWVSSFESRNKVEFYYVYLEELSNEYGGWNSRSMMKYDFVRALIFDDFMKKYRPTKVGKLYLARYTGENGSDPQVSLVYSKYPVAGTWMVGSDLYDFYFYQLESYQ